MDLVTVRELYRNREEYLDKEVTIGGWVRSIRDSKTFGFIVVNDGSFFESTFAMIFLLYSNQYSLIDSSFFLKKFSFSFMI